MNEIMNTRIALSSHPASLKAAGIVKAPVPTIKLKTNTRATL